MDSKIETKGGEKITLVITGTHYPGEDEPIVTVQEVEASFFQKGEASYWLYEERLEGHPHPYNTRMKYKGNVLELVRRNANSTGSMVFETGKSYRTEYPTPFGSLALDIITHSVERLDMPEGTPELRVCYTLEHQGQALGKYELHIEKKGINL